MPALQKWPHTRAGVLAPVPTGPELPEHTMWHQSGQCHTAGRGKTPNWPVMALGTSSHPLWPDTGLCLQEPASRWSCQLHEEALPRKKGRILVERDKPGQTEFHLLLAESVSVLSLLPLDDVISYKVIWYKTGPGFWSMLDQKIWEFSFSTNKQEFFYINRNLKIE